MASVNILEIIDHLESEIRRAFSDAVRRVGNVARGFALVAAAGYSCPNVTAILFKGSDRDSTGYWTAVCSDGGTWIVQVKNDPASTMSVTPWALLNTLNIEGLKKF